jgi:hypothetical protein
VCSALVSQFGEPAEKRTLEEMVGEGAAAMRYSGIVSSGWYPVEWFCELLRAADEAVPSENHLARRLGEESTRRDLGGVYASLMRLLGPQHAFRHAERVLNAYMRGARLLTEQHSRSRVMLRVQVPGLDQRAWQYVLGSMSVVAWSAVGPSAVLRIVDGGLNHMDAMAVDVKWVVPCSAANIAARQS